MAATKILHSVQNDIVGGLPNYWTTRRIDLILAKAFNSVPRDREPQTIMPSRLKLEDLIDLETQLQRDQDESLRQLRQRDAEIGRKIDAVALSGNELFLAWLAELRSDRPGEPTTGSQVASFLQAVGVVLVLVGGLLGGGAVAGWLRLNPAEPVNAVLFWLSIIGLQLLFLVAWLFAVVPRRWIAKLPGAGGLQLLVRSIGRLPPVIAAGIATRMSEDTRQRLREVGGAVTRFDWLYGKIKFWLLIRLTQVFAVAYNTGAILVFVLMTHGNDPAFSWRSTVLDESQIHSATDTVSLPWSQLAPDATLTSEDLAATQYSSFDAEFLTNSSEAHQTGWRRWSFFLLASLLAYGFAPRCITLVLAHLGVGRAIAAVQLDHAEFQKLADRLKRPFVNSAAALADDEAQIPATANPLGGGDAMDADGPFPALKCDGVKLSHEEVAELIQARFAKAVSTVRDVLGADAAADAAALEQLTADAPGAAIVLVEAWEPPVQEYLDLLRKLRTAIGERRMIDVVLYNRSVEGKNIAARQRDVDMWRGQLATTGDPWLRVETLIEEAVA